jgi:tetratricopeptide (TPR) repeat protein
VLKEVTEINDNLLLDSLDKLMEADIIHEVSGSKEEEFIFAHKLTRSVVYESMSKSRVRVLHMSVGEIIERLYSDNLDPWVFELARHFTTGKSFPNAYKYSIIAGDKAFRTLAFEEAVEHYISALRIIDFLQDAENLDKDVEKLRLSMTIGDIYISLANFPTAKQYYDIALQLSRKMEDEKAEDKALIALGHSLRLAGDFRKAEESYESAVKISDKLGDLESMAEVQRGLGYVHWRKGQNDDAVEHYNQSISLSMKAGDLSSMAKTFVELGNVYNHWGDQNKAIEYYNKSLDEFEKLNDFSELARAHNNLGDSYMKLKNWDKAIEHLDKSGIAAEKIGNKQFIAWALFNSAEALANMGELDKALTYCESAWDICETQDDKIGMQGIFKNYGLIYRLKKEWNKSIENFNKSIVILEMLDIAYELGIAYFELAKTYEEMGETNEAVNNLKMAKDLFENVGAKPEAKEAEEKVKALETQ